MTPTEKKELRIYELLSSEPSLSGVSYGDLRDAANKLANMPANRVDELRRAGMYQDKVRG